MRDACYEFRVSDESLNRKEISYRNLDIYKTAFDLFVKTHPLTFRLPNYELYELGSQLQRSSDSVVSNIVEGYGRRVYKKEFERFLVFSHASNDETLNHIEKIIILYPNLSPEFEELRREYNILGGKINNYLKWVREKWNKNEQ